MQTIFRKCIENKLGLEDFQFKKDGTTLKISSITCIDGYNKDYKNCCRLLWESFILKSS